MIDNFLKKYKIDIDKRKAISLLLGSLLGIIIGVIIAKTIYVKLSRICLPGFLSLISIFLLTIQFVLRGHLNKAIKVIYLIPIPVYFYLISTDHALYPPQSSFYIVLYTLIAGTIFMLIFAERVRSILIFCAIAITSLIAHVFIAEKTDLLLKLQWADFGNRLNPVAAMLLTTLFAWLIFFNFKRQFNLINSKYQRLKNRVDFSLKNLNQGVIVLEILRDEHDEISNLRIKKVNKLFEKTFRISARKITGKHAEDIFPNLFRDSFNWRNFFVQRKKRNTEVFLKHMDHWFTITQISPEKNIIIGLFQDITVLKQHIEKLSESEQRNKALLEAVPDIYFVIDKDGIYVDYVAKQQEMVKMNPEKIIGSSIMEVGFSEKMTRVIYQSIQNVIKFDTTETIEYAFETPHGTMLFEMRMVKLNDHSVISLARDITTRKLAEQKLEEAKNKAEEADQLKSAFLSNLSHEIRTPMNAIIGFARMLMADDFNKVDREKFVNIIISNGEQLMSLISDMISLSKIETDQIEVDRSYFKINQLMGELYRNFTHQKNKLEKPDIKLILTTQNNNPNFAIYTDGQLLREILNHLIGNALKFTSKGEIEFGYKVREDNYIEFFVHDTGIGIPEESKESVFMRFHQLDNQKSRNYEGTGLGLSIAQYYANKLDSELDFKSEVGVGSTFFFAFKIEKADNYLKIV